MLSLRVAQLDVQLAEAGQLSDHSSKAYLAWSNALERCLSRLSLAPAAAAAKSPSIDDYIKNWRASQAEDRAA